MAVRIDEERLRARLTELAEIGRTPDGGVSRFSYGTEHAAAVRRVARWMREAGAEPAVDVWGNLFGVVPGEAGALPPIAAGSHLDTVPNGGKFDGALGVLAAVEAAAALRDAGVRPKHTLLLVAFAEEEGTSYGVGCLGSLGVVGRAPALEGLHDAAGQSAADALRAFDTGLPRRSMPMPMAAYLELHIEQGPVLAARETPLAAVDAIVGIARAVFEFTGEANHAGTTPMDMRRDALWGAADLVGAVRTIVRDTGGRAVGTVGRLELSPGATNVVPGRAAATVELRSSDARLLESLRERVESDGRACAARYGLALEVRAWRSDTPVPLNRSIHDEIVAAAGDLGWPIVTMSSWAGHDAKILGALVPTGMIFVPSVGGVSHSPREQTAWDDVARGAQVLCRAMERLDRSQAA
ncbi:MAG TPA: Zn-dependent hydrolase [bacterium]|nr:Zn-dependent hydrolase [bacterium]